MYSNLKQINYLFRRLVIWHYRTILIDSPIDLARCSVVPSENPLFETIPESRCSFSGHWCTILPLDWENWSILNGRSSGCTQNRWRRLVNHICLGQAGAITMILQLIPKIFWRIGTRNPLLYCISSLLKEI